MSCGALGFTCLCYSLAVQYVHDGNTLIYVCTWWVPSHSSLCAVVHVHMGPVLMHALLAAGLSLVCVALVGSGQWGLPTYRIKRTDDPA